MRANTASHCMRIRARANRARGRRRPRQHARDARHTPPRRRRRRAEARRRIARKYRHGNQRPRHVHRARAAAQTPRASGDLEKVIALLDDGADGNIRACGEVRPRARRATTRWWMNSSIGRGRRVGARDASRAAGRRGNSMRWWTVGDWGSRRDARRTRARRTRAMTDGTAVRRFYARRVMQGRRRRCLPRAVDTWTC